MYSIIVTPLELVEWHARLMVMPAFVDDTARTVPFWPPVRASELVVQRSTHCVTSSVGSPNNFLLITLADAGLSRGQEASP
jgi:hypothetical protein